MNGNSIGDEGVRALISGLSSRKGMSYDIRGLPVNILYAFAIH